MPDIDAAYDFSRLSVRQHGKNLELVRYRDPDMYREAREKLAGWLEEPPVATKHMAQALRHYLRVFYTDHGAPMHENTRAARLAQVRVIPFREGFCAYTRYEGKRRTGPTRATETLAEQDRIPLYKRVILAGVKEWIDAQESSTIVIPASEYDLTVFD